MKTYFISGHLDLTEEEFELHYKPKIDEALKDGCGFIVGDAKGADLLAQKYLCDKTHNVIVYHMLEYPRNNCNQYETKGGYASDTGRDEAMTFDSDEDIAWVRVGREKSGTAKNLQRRERL